MLAPFSIIVALDSAGGIAKDGTIPWTSKEDAIFFRTTTIGRRKNAVIMGRNTYESIPENFRPLEGRHTIVVSKTMKQEEHQGIIICSSVIEALSVLGGSINSYDEIFISGGEFVYREAVTDLLYLCKKIYVTKFKMDYECDQFFPLSQVIKCCMPLESNTLPNKENESPTYFQDPYKSRDYTRFFYVPNVEHDEMVQYQALITRIKDKGENKTGGIKALYSQKCNFNLERLPLLTTRKINFESVIKDVLEIKYNVQDLVSGLYKDPTKYQLLNIDRGILQFIISGDRQYLDLHVYIAISDCFSELPSQIAFYAIFNYMIAHLSVLKPRTLYFTIGEAYLIVNQGDAINKMLKRTPKPFATLELRGANHIKQFDQFNPDSFIINYDSWPAISVQ